MMLMGINSMKSRFMNEPDILAKLTEIESGLKQNTLQLNEAKIKMSQMQGAIMQKMMM